MLVLVFAISFIFFLFIYLFMYLFIYLFVYLFITIWMFEAYLTRHLAIHNYNVTNVFVDW